MNSRTLAIALITLGIVVLAYSGITYRTPGRSADVLGVHVETTHSHFIPPAAGAVALVVGVVLLAAGSKAT
jgi:hypothetical protein